MRKITFFILSFLVGTSTLTAQTTLKYSGSGTSNYNGATFKIAGIGDMDVLNAAERANDHAGLAGQGTNGIFTNVGVYGTTQKSTLGSTPFYVGVWGDNQNNDINEPLSEVYGGLFTAKNMGANSTSLGVQARGYGTNNTSQVMGVYATANNLSNTTPWRTIAVQGITYSGTSTTSTYLKNIANPGGYFNSSDGQGIFATTIYGYNHASFGRMSQGVTGYSNINNAYLNAGVVGYAEGTGNYKFGTYGFLDGTAGTSTSAGVCGQDNINASNTYAGYFYGKVSVSGNLSVNGTFNATGTKNFMIDHPLDPENKILRHAAIESNEVLNQYSGNVITDALGFATVTLPNYFETLNKDFRYQLTIIGSFAQAIIKEEVAHNQFVIQTNQPSVKVSWQVTGVRNDKVMQYQPFVAETEKTGNDKGNYLSPEAYGKPAQDHKMIPAFGYKDPVATPQQQQNIQEPPRPMQGKGNF